METEESWRGGVISRHGLALSPLLRRGERERRRGALARLLPLLHGFCGGEGRGEEERVSQCVLMEEPRNTRKLTRDSDSGHFRVFRVFRGLSSAGEPVV